MESDYLGDVYTLADIASAAGSTEEEVRAVAGSVRRFGRMRTPSASDALLVTGRYAASTVETPLFSQSRTRNADSPAAGIPVVVSGSLHLGLLGVLLIATWSGSNRGDQGH